MTGSTKVGLQTRMMALGIGEGELARYLGQDPAMMSQYLERAGDSPEARYLHAIIAALELMQPEQRERWKRRVRADGPRDR